MIKNHILLSLKCLKELVKFNRLPEIYFNLEEFENELEDSVITSISKIAEDIGFKTFIIEVNQENVKDLPCPFILLQENNYPILIKNIRRRFVNIYDPLLNKELKLPIKRFRDKYKVFVALNILHLGQTNTTTDKLQSVKRLKKYLYNYRYYISQLFLGLLIASGLNFFVPYLAQMLIDNGISKQNMNIVVVILLAQLTIFLSQSIIETIRSWLFHFVGGKIYIQLVSDFIAHVMRIPLSFFNQKSIGDILQRIGDHSRIQNFLTNSTLNILYSLLNLFIFGVVIINYSFNIFLLYFIGSIISIAWVIYFSKHRKTIDRERFELQSSNQSKLVQLIAGVQDIKLYNAEITKRWEWEKIQNSLYNINSRSLKINQLQTLGNQIILQIKNLLISYLTAKLVIEGHMTIGSMFAIAYIVGQLNAPIAQFLTFFQTTQDSILSLNRIDEVYTLQSDNLGHIRTSPRASSITVEGLSFNYGNASILKNFSYKFESGKVTAVVGASGSGKTTLIRLLLKNYSYDLGSIKVFDSELRNINTDKWRGQCGAVLQEGYIFSDSLLNNIIIDRYNYDSKRLEKAIEISNLTSFISSLPQGIHTFIGMGGQGISQGQRQRILIARVIYKRPNYIFLDEATSALDSESELTIMKKTIEYFKDKMIIIVAHRLSSINFADDILVLKEGKCIEYGHHKDLIKNRDEYFKLIANQIYQV